MRNEFRTVPRQICRGHQNLGGARRAYGAGKERTMAIKIKWRATAVAVSMILLVPFVAQAAGEADARMQALEDRMRSLEDRLIASEATVAAQRQLLRAQPTPDVAQGGMLDGFLNGLEWGGYVEASYIYNFSNPDFNEQSQVHMQFNRNHNDFKLDAIKLELGKPASEPGTAGFQIDLLWGENANILEWQDVVREDDEDLVDFLGSASVYIQEGYVSYNYEGVELRLGKFETPFGYEVLDAPYNPHVTHSTLFWGAIPLLHTGLTASGNLNEDFSWALGVVNGFDNETDFNDNKGVLGQVGWTNENASVAFNVFVGSEGLRASSSRGLACISSAPADGVGGGGDCFGDDNNKTSIYDLVATLSPAENIELWGEAVYGYQEVDSLVVLPLGRAVSNGEEDPQWIAVALGGVYQLSEKTSVALRAEYFHDDGNFRLGHGAFGQEADHYSGTVTLAHRLTDNLSARLEYRHDRVDGSQGTDDAVFYKSDNSFDDQQDIGILEVNYRFD
jgi:hypothetical protein